MLMYHVSFKSRSKKILKEGITTGHKRNWNTPFGVKLGKVDRIYLFKNYTSAVSWAGKMEYDMERDIVILKVKIFNTIEQDTNTGAVIGDWYRTSNTIKPKDIIKCIPLTLELKRELTSGKLNVKEG
jgi:hypothetical protein